MVQRLGPRHNPLRAGLVRRAEDWAWSSLGWWLRPGEAGPLAIDPAGRPEDWADLVNVPLTQQELVALRRSENRGTPLGQDRWVSKAAAKLGLEHTLRPRGRPRKTREK